MDKKLMDEWFLNLEIIPAEDAVNIFEMTKEI